jgi:hypothetical protein
MASPFLHGECAAIQDKRLREPQKYHLESVAEELMNKNIERRYWGLAYYTILRIKWGDAYVCQD